MSCKEKEIKLKKSYNWGNFSTVIEFECPDCHKKGTVEICEPNEIASKAFRILREKYDRLLQKYTTLNNKVKVN